MINNKLLVLKKYVSNHVAVFIKGKKKNEMLLTEMKEKNKRGNKTWKGIKIWKGIKSVNGDIQRCRYELRFGLEEMNIKRNKTFQPLCYTFDKNQKTYFSINSNSCSYEKREKETKETEETERKIHKNETNNIIDLLKSNKKTLLFLKRFFLINYLILFLTMGSILLFFDNFLHRYILSTIEKMLDELKQSAEIKKKIKEAIDHWIHEILQDEKNKIIASTFFVNVLKHSENEIGDIFIKILKTEQVENKLKSIFTDIAKYLSNNNNVQKDVSHLLIEAINLPKSIEHSKQWLIDLFDSEDVKTNLKNILIKELFKSKEMQKNATDFTKEVFENTLNNEEIQNNTKQFFYSIMSNQQFQQQISENVWKILKLTVSPKWLNQEGIGVAMNQTENKIKFEKEKNKDKKIDEDILQGEIKNLLDLYEDIEEDTMKRNEELGKKNEVIENTEKEEMGKIPSETNITTKNINTDINIEETSNIVEDKEFKESFENFLNLFLLLNSTICILNNINKKIIHFELPILKIKNCKRDYENVFVSYLLELLEHANWDILKNDKNIKNNEKESKENKLITYSLEEKIHLALLDIILYYSFKYYFYYYYIRNCKLILQNILQI